MLKPILFNSVGFFLINRPDAREGRMGAKRKDMEAMSEARAVTLETSVDTTGARAGFQEMKQGGLIWRPQNGLA